MGNSLKHKALFLFVIVFTFISFVFYFFFEKSQGERLFKTREEALKGVSLLLEHTILNFFEHRNKEALRRDIQSLKDHLGIEILILDIRGKPLYLSGEKLKNQGGLFNEVREAIIEKETITKKFRDENGIENVCYARLIRKGNSLAGVLVLSSSLEDGKNSIWFRKVWVVSYILLVSLVFLVFLIFLEKRAYKPLLVINQTLDRIADRGLREDEVIPFLEKSSDAVSLKFKDLLEKLRSDFESLSKKLKDYETILTRISDLLLVVDEEGRIKIFNEAFKSLMGDRLQKGSYYWEVIREPSFREVFKEHSSLIKKGEMSISKEIKLKARYFRLSGSSISPTGERIYLLHDITEMMEVERMKRDFIANLSHELRTPLSAIKGFAETLEYEESLKDKTYVEIIKRNTDRLIRIVNDLLLLSKLEEGKVVMEIGDVNLKEVIEPLIKLFEQKIREKNLEFILDIEEDVTIRGDRFQIEQLLINLIDNAVKYTDRGYVKIQVKREKDVIVIKVEDSGIGIPEKHQRRIFERFYVVDKSRSKKNDGTGLGLSIVKHIVMLHGGRIEVKSAPGEGSQFVIFIPLREATKN